MLGKLREFQDAGHLAVLVIGDWTARVGDPSGRTSTRPMLSGEEIDANAATYREQAFRILDPERTEIRSNGEWFAGMGLEDVFRLAGRATVNQLLRRNDFAERMADDRPVSVLELLYPLMQAYDSVELRADVELGGTDQLFNLHARARDPERLRPGAPGRDDDAAAGRRGRRRKMSKSLGNHIGVADPPEEQFGRTMSVPDAALAEWYRLLAPGEPPPGGRPAEDKRRLGRLVADRFHGSGAGERAEDHFNRVVRDRQAPEEVPEIAIAEGTVHLPALLADALGVPSRSEARRLIAGGGVTLDGERVTEIDLPSDALDGRVIRAGKRRFARLRAGGDGADRSCPDGPASLDRRDRGGILPRPFGRFVPAGGDRNPIETSPLRPPAHGDARVAKRAMRPRGGLRNAGGREGGNRVDQAGRGSGRRDP